ncbi:MAG TPA: GxxExxY protein [Balneolaceae bacterium]
MALSVAKETQSYPKGAIMDVEKLSNITIGAAIEVHRQLGPGLLESAYQRCLSQELTDKNISVETEKPMPIVYKSVKLDHGYRMDLVIENKLVVEIKTVETFTDVHVAQLLTYLRLGNYKLGLLVNFNVNLLKNGIKRLIL